MYRSKVKKAKKKESLNNWDICNPRIFVDQLPQPFR